MFKINRKIEYALIALKHMSQKKPNELTSAKEISSQYCTPFDPTSRVLQIMAQQHVLHAEQGARGGYQITKDLNAFSLRELSEMIIGPIEIANCFNSDDCNCEILQKCHIISPMLNLNENINNLFSTIMVSELIESKHHAEKSIRDKKIAESSTASNK